MPSAMLESLTSHLAEVPLETWFVVTVLLLVATVFLYLVFSGLLHSVTVSTSDTKYGPVTFAYKTHTGPYKNVGEIFTESFCLVPDREQLGIYYDDPEGVSPDQLRAAVGPILAIGNQKADPAEMEKVIKEGFRITHLPKASFVVTASFPFRTTLSIFLAIYKVYPKLRDYISQRNLCAYPAIEIYTDTEIVFIMPLSRQEEFFVSEYQEEEMSVATTDMTGSVMAGDAGCRDKDGFLIPQSPRDEPSNDSVDVTADGDNSEIGDSIDDVDISYTTEEDEEEQITDNIATEGSVHSRDS